MGDGSQNIGGAVARGDQRAARGLRPHRRRRLRRRGGTGRRIVGGLHLGRKRNAANRLRQTTRRIHPDANLRQDHQRVSGDSRAHVQRQGDRVQTRRGQQDHRRVRAG